MRLGMYFACAVAALWLAASPPAAVAQSDDYVNGEITKVDEATGKITIRHGPIKKFDTDKPMTMAFRASDPAMLKAVKPGDRVRFVTDRINDQFTLMKIEKVK